MGFRDSNQDLLGFVHLVPDRARERILDIAATQFPDGSAYHQYQPLTKRGNNDVGSGFNDDPLWLILGVAGVPQGDRATASILDEMVPFDNDEAQAASAVRAPDAARSSSRVDNRGPHGLPLIGRADWNDCLNLNCFSTEPGESFQTTENQAGGTAESVFIAAHVRGDRPRVRRDRRAPGPGRRGRACPRGRRRRCARPCMAHGWDGEWFLRAYDFYGNTVGTDENDEGKIWIEPQGMAIMGGIGLTAPTRRPAHASSARARARLGERAARHRRTALVLQYPAYTSYQDRARRGLHLPAGLQGERRASSATTTRG